MPLTPEDLATIRRMIREEVRAAISDALLRDPKLTGISRSSPESQRPASRPQSQGDRWAAQIAAFLSQPDTREGEKYVRGIIQTAALCGFDRGLMTMVTSQAAQSPDDPYRRGLVQINAVRRWLKGRPEIIELIRQEYANKVYERDPADPP